MITDSRKNLYDYLYSLFYGVVTNNVYAIREPQQLTNSDTTDGFIVIKVGDINDESEFKKNAYAWARCYIEAYIPPISRGRLDYDKYETFERNISEVIAYAATDGNTAYFVQEDSVLSSDIDDARSGDNEFFTFIKSFVVNIDN